MSKDRVEALTNAIVAALKSGRTTGWETGFLGSNLGRLIRYGEQVRFSDRQFEILQRIFTNCRIECEFDSAA